MAKPESVVIVHYHLRGGGVTKVIEHAQAALDKAGIKSAVIVGESPDDSAGNIKNIGVIEDLAYSKEINISSDKLLQKALSQSKKLLGSEPDLWHIHNHSLGKNIATPLLVKALCDDGRSALLQPHDFAEDGRPENYRLLNSAIKENFSGVLYPQGKNIHYAFINNRDLSFMRKSGAIAANLHYLPNAAEISVSDSGEKLKLCDGKFYLYPTRAIRRKNLGEFLFWAAVSERDNLFACTMAPKNPQAKPLYDAWVSFAEKMGLPVLFEAGKKYNFEKLMSSADALVTTSVAEGFGLAFLEAALLEQNLFGRKLPEITDEFEYAGLDLSGMYDKLMIDQKFIDIEVLRKKIENSLRKVYGDYGWNITEEDIGKCFASTCVGGRVDFGKLDEELQMSLIENICTDPQVKNEFSEYSLSCNIDNNIQLKNNCEVARSKYNIEVYQNNLLEIYEKVMAGGDDSSLSFDAQNFLSEYLKPERFNLLRT